MTQLSYPYTLVAGTPENVNQVQSNFDAAKSLINGGLDTTNLATSTAGITDAQLASPNSGIYKFLFREGAMMGGAVVAGTYGISSRSGFTVTGGDSVNHLPIFYLASADYLVASKTTKLRLRGVIVTNATAPGMNFTFGLYPITSSGSTFGQIVWSLGTVVTGSTIAINAPGASSRNNAATSDFTLPADGYYVLGVVTSGSTANNSYSLVQAELHFRNV